MRGDGTNFSNFGSLKSTETVVTHVDQCVEVPDFSNFGSLKSTETAFVHPDAAQVAAISAISAR